MLSYTWGIWKQNVGLNQIHKDWSIITWAAMWNDDTNVIGYKIPDFKGYTKDLRNDKKLMEKLWPLLDKADIVVAHNAVRFDIPKINTRFLYHGITPPSPYKMVDTLKVAKRYFGFTSNRLDYISKFLGFDGKIDTGGMDLWLDCLSNKKEAWDKMLSYNKQDIVILKEVYSRLLPYIQNHPNVTHGLLECNACGGTDVQCRGFVYTQAGKYQKYVCKSCGKWGRDIKNLLTKEDRVKTFRNIS
jgi:uncharacterized protein YprB with RNaseH-like and TPR domain